MRVLITGATGFFGRHVARSLAEQGTIVAAVRRAASDLAPLGDVARAIEWFDADGDRDRIFGRSFDAVIHAATAYGRPGKGPVDVHTANVEWPSTILAAAAAAGTALFVNIDTSLPPAISPYAKSKRAFADAVRAAAERKEIRVLNVRLESVYGAGDDPAKFQMQLLHALIRGEPSFALTRGVQARDYIFVDDAVEGFRRLFRHATQEEARYLEAGIGRGEGVTIREFAETAKRIAESATRLDFGVIPDRANELMHAQADVTLLYALGWKGARDLETGLGATIARERQLLAT